MDRNVDVRTPESIAFRYELAGLGSRALATLVDMAIQIALLLLIFFGVIWAGAHAGPTPPLSASDDNFYRSIAIAIIVFVIFTILYGYYILFEALWGGQTPGKKLLRIRVVRDGGYPLDFGGSFLRNLIRIAEQILGFYLIAAVSALASPENKRVGDYAAGTIVVREGRSVKPQTLREAIAASGAARSGAYLTGDERELVARFLERRASLDGHRRSQLAYTLANRFRERAPADIRALPDEVMLERL